MLNRRLVAGLTGLALMSLPLAAASPARAVATHDPVVTVYGFGGNSGQFDPIKKKLVSAGWSSNGFYNFGYIATNSNVQDAKELKKYVEKVKTQTGAARVDLLVHSMGSISSRYYLKSLGGTSSVDAWISLGGANKGTTYASLCSFAFAACADMVPGSPILNGLNRRDATPGAVRYFTHYSSCDGVIEPYTNILVEGATNTNAGCVAHNDYFSDAVVQALVQKELG